MNEGNPQLRAVVVDDDPMIRGMLRAILEACGCAVVGEANDGEAAVELVRESRPELILLDIHMPVKDGITVLREIRAEDANAYVVMVTASDDEETVEECIVAGARDFVRKDIPTAQIGPRLERHVRRAAARLAREAEAG